MPQLGGNMSLDTQTLSLVVAIGLGVFTIAGVMIGLMLWVRGEANVDRRALQASIDAIKEDGRIFREAWAAESKDFHGRLCAIEERRNKILLKE